MSKQSKSKRDRKKRRRTESSVTSVQKRKQTDSGFDWKRWLLIGGGIVVALVLVGVLWFTLGPGGSSGEEGSMPADPATRNGMYSEPPPMQIDPAKQYIATIGTEKGDIVAELFPDKVPATVNNFVFLARAGFFDNTTFHRVIPDFMAQAGDPTASGGGSPGYRFSDEFHPDLGHDSAGILSMANMGADTNGSQFFITYQPTPWLDAYDADGNLKDCQRVDVSCHAVFGKVTEGMDVVEALTPRDPGQNPAFPGDLIKAIRIEER
jgi:cyclophilin family peptidyl-prolyl cis-trans isomerase